MLCNVFLNIIKNLKFNNYYFFVLRKVIQLLIYNFDRYIKILKLKLDKFYILLFIYGIKLQLSIEFGIYIRKYIVFN